MVSLGAAARGPLRRTRTKLGSEPCYRKPSMTRGETRNRRISACTQSLLSRSWWSPGGFGNWSSSPLKDKLWGDPPPPPPPRGCPVTPVMSRRGAASIIGRGAFPVRSQQQPLPFQLPLLSLCSRNVCVEPQTLPELCDDQLVAHGPLHVYWWGISWPVGDFIKKNI